MVVGAVTVWRLGRCQWWLRIEGEGGWANGGHDLNLWRRANGGYGLHAWGKANGGYGLGGCNDRAIGGYRLGVGRGGKGQWWLRMGQGAGALGANGGYGLNRISF